MSTGTTAIADMLRNDIRSVHGFTSNGVQIFESNVDAALTDWLSWNPDVSRLDEYVRAIVETCSELAGYLRNAGVMPKSDEVDRLKDAAADAVEALCKRYPD